MSTDPTSPHLAPTSPNAPGATSGSDLAHRPPPYGGEVAEKPNSDHHTNTHNHPHVGEVRGEVKQPYAHAITCTTRRLGRCYQACACWCHHPPCWPHLDPERRR